MRRALLLSLASTALILGACSDQRSPDPVGPEDVEADASLIGPCPSPAQEALLDDIRADIDDLFIGRGGKRSPTAHIDNIERKLCQEQYDDALDMAWGFLGLLTEKIPDEFDGDAQDAAQLASDVFALVGADPNPAGTAFEIPPEVFEPGGTIVTFDPSTASQENPIVISIDDNLGGEDVAALVIDDPNVFPPGTGLVTVAMYRAPDDVVTTGQTFIPGFAASPVGVEIISSHQPWDQGPGILVALCALGGNVIGHNHDGGVELLVPTDPDPEALGYIVCGDIDEYFGSGGEETFFGHGADGAPAWAQLAHRLVEPLGRFLAPRALNADAVAMGEAGPGLGGRTRSLSLDAPVDAQIEVEESVQLSVGTEATWTSSDENVATVDAEGLVTGVSDGTATIEATFTDVTGALATLSMTITVGTGSDILLGTRIVFASGRDGNEEIYAMDVDGSNETRLTNEVLLDNAPTWSPDGTRIAWMSLRTETPLIYTMNRFGGDIQGGYGTSVNGWPSWSNDGTRIAYIGGGGLRIMDDDGTNDGAVSAGGGAGASSDWSPDDTKIVTTIDNEIVVVDLVAGTSTSLTSNFVDSSPTYSPDGTRIAFHRRTVSGGQADVYVMDADGMNVTNLTNDPDADLQPGWSSDGSQIVFWSDRSESQLIWVMNADGTGTPAALSSGGSDFDPEWQPQTPPIIID